MMPRGVRNCLRHTQLLRCGPTTRRVTCTQGWRPSHQLAGSHGSLNQTSTLGCGGTPVLQEAANVAHLLAVEGHGVEATLESEDDVGYPDQPAGLLLYRTQTGVRSHHLPGHSSALPVSCCLDTARIQGASGDTDFQKEKFFKKSVICKKNRVFVRGCCSVRRDVETDFERSPRFAW